MARVKTYDPKKVKVLFGSLILTGVDEGTFINVETQGDGISAIVGCDQEIVRSIDPSSVLKQVTVTLLQSSSSNAALSLIQDADNQNGAGLLSLTIKDLSGDSVMVSDQAWIVKKPNFQRGKSASDGKCEWVFMAVVPDEAFLVGGHS